MIKKGTQNMHRILDFIYNYYYVFLLPFLSISVFYAMEYLSRGLDFFVSEKGVRWKFLFVTAFIQFFVITSLLPVMLKDTDSPVVTDIQEILAQSEKAQQESAQAQMQEAQMQKELQIAELQAKIREMQAEALKKETQAQQIQAMTTQMQENPLTSDKLIAKSKKQMQISNSDMR